MCGNRLGWVISLFIAAGGVYLAYQLLLLEQPTAPTGWVAATVQPLQISELVKPVLEPMTNLKDDAGDLYRQACADYEANRSAYETLQSSQKFNAAAIAARPGLEDVVKAAGCPAMNLFISKPADIVGFSDRVTELEALGEIAKTIGGVIESSKGDGHNDVANKYANALVVLGYHLYNERLAYPELKEGESDLGMGLAAMRELAQAQQIDSRINAIAQADSARRDEFDKRVEPVISVIASEAEQDIAKNAGDMFQLAGDSSADRVWRVEAIRKVGRLQFNAGRAADQRKAPKFLARLAADQSQDQVIRAAAQIAHDMTAADNQSQR